MKLVLYRTALYLENAPSLTPFPGWYGGYICIARTSGNSWDQKVDGL